MSEEVTVFPEEEKEEATNELEELEVPDNTEFGYVVAMTTDGNLHFQAFGGENNLKKIWLLAGLSKAAQVIINSMVEKQINTSSTAITGEMLLSMRQLVQVMRGAIQGKQPKEVLQNVPEENKE